jgi:hypothetical protein
MRFCFQFYKKMQQNEMRFLLHKKRISTLKQAVFQQNLSTSKDSMRPISRVKYDCRNEHKQKNAFCTQNA